MPVDVQKLARRFRQLEAESSSFRAVCDQVEKYVMPRVGGTATGHATSTEGSATWKDPDVWDFTAPVALAKLAAHIHTSVMPPGLRWGAFAWEDEELQNDEECAKALEVRTDMVFHALEESDFDGEMSSAFQEYVGPGNMVVVQEVVETPTGEWGGLDFTAVPIREVEFEENSKGRMKTFYRHLRWTPVQILDKFGETGTPEKIRERAASEAGGTERVSVVFCIFERAEILARPTKDLVAAPDQRPYGYVYFLLDSAERVGEEGGYYDFPAFVGRWQRTVGSRWAHGLGQIALSHVKGLNAFVELVLTACALAVDPPDKVTERGLLSDLDRRPGGLTVVESLDDHAPLDQGTRRIDVGEFSLEEQRAEVRRLFYEDQLTLKDSPQMSATEAQLRYDIMLKLLGPVVARLITECVNPLLMGTYRALLRAGKFPKPPQKVLEREAELRIVYRGAFARSRRTDEVAAIERAAAFAANLLKMGFNEILDDFRPGQAFRKVCELLEVSAGVVASESESRQNRERRKAMEERLVSAKAAKDEADAAAKGAQAGGLPATAAGALPFSPQPALGPGGQVL